MFFQLVSSFVGYVSDLIDCMLSNDLLSYVFYLGILGFVVVGIKYIIAFNSSDLGGKK